MRSAVASRSHCATAPSTLTTRRPPALLVSRDSAALMSEARSATLRVQRSSLAISTAPTYLTAPVRERKSISIACSRERLRAGGFDRGEHAKPVRHVRQDVDADVLAPLAGGRPGPAPRAPSAYR